MRYVFGDCQGPLNAFSLTPYFMFGKVERKCLVKWLGYGEEDDEVDDDEKLGTLSLNIPPILIASTRYPALSPQFRAVETTNIWVARL
jgi:hypothetical protein